MNDSDRQEVEERLMTDEDFYQKLSLVEEDVVQEYADGNLTAAERLHFEKCFLISEENRQKVRFATALRKYIDETNSFQQENEKNPSFFDSIKSFFVSPVPAAFAVLIVLSIGGFWIWKSHSSGNSESLVALNNAYKSERPFESRITGLDYAPPKNTRGAEDKTNKTELDLAQTLALKSASDDPTAENLHTLGKIYLAQKLFDKAIEQFRKALAITINNPDIHNELGVAIMEKAQLSDEGKLENLSEALKEFEKAIGLNPTFQDALFNKAICLELIPIPNQAKTAWSEYLKVDSASSWSNEARNHLKKLDTQSSKDLSSAEFEQKFFESYFRKNDDELWKTVSRNRELVKLKYLPQRLAMTYVESAGEDRKKTLAALKHLGNLERDRIGDLFALDLADFYERLPESKIETLRNAYASTRRGYDLCLNGKYSAAIAEFTKASELFISAGNLMEANAISRHLIAYCLYNINRRKEAVSEFRQTNLFCERRKYKWLQLAASYWLTGWSADSFDFHSSEKAKQAYLNGLKISENMGDFFYMQKYLQTLAARSQKLGQEKEMMFYLQKLFEISSNSGISLRQKFRNYSTGLQMIVYSDFASLAKEIASEELKLASESGENSYIATAYIDSSIVQTQANNFSEASEYLSEARKTSEFLSENSQREELLADILFKTGNLESKKNNYREAVRYYDESLKIIEAREDAPVMLYDLSKQRLTAYQNLGNDIEVGKQIPEVLKIADKYRSEILEEKERYSFFDNEQNIYDIAVNHELHSGNIKKAFYYSETSNSRSLLDWLQKGIDKSDKEKEIINKGSTDPLTLEEIQTRMPSEVQILQYTVLDKKVLIWIISKESINVVSSEITSQDMDEKVTDYLNLIQSLKPEDQIQAKIIGRELYNILMAPALPYLDKNKEICLIPSKSLFQLPFAALISPSEDFFITEFDFFYAPSASVFILCTEKALKKQINNNERFLGIGNPSFDRQKFSDLQDLPDSEKEVGESSSFYQNPRIISPKQSTKKLVTDLYRNFEIVHFAGHYIVQHSSPLSSGLVLAKDEDSGVLTNYELAGDNLANTKLVVLSACQTGVEGYYRGEGLVGLSRTFLASGVPLVIASQWKVDSDATAELMKNFHRYRKQENLSSMKALRRAQIDMLKNENEGYSSPYYWAAFAGFGGYTRF